MHSKQLSLFITVFSLLLGLSCKDKENKIAKKEITSSPNIIYILADDLGYADLSSYGQKKFTTPNIDRLAKQGMLFTQHYSGSTVCAPSRSALMTGMHTGHTVVRGNKEIQPEGQHPIPEDTYTIAEALKKQAIPLEHSVNGDWVSRDRKVTPAIRASTLFLVTIANVSGIIIIPTIYGLIGIPSFLEKIREKKMVFMPLN